MLFEASHFAYSMRNRLCVSDALKILPFMNMDGAWKLV